MKKIAYGLVALLFATACSEAQSSKSSSSAESAGKKQETDRVVIPKKSGFYQIGVAQCEAQKQLPDHPDFPEKFEVFVDGFNRVIGKSAMAATVILDLENSRRMIAEGVSAATKDDSKLEVKYEVRSMIDNTVSVAVIKIGRSDSDELVASLALDGKSAEYKCVNSK